MVSQPIDLGWWTACRHVFKYYFIFAMLIKIRLQVVIKSCIKEVLWVKLIKDATARFASQEFETEL